MASYARTVYYLEGNNDELNRFMKGVRDTMSKYDFSNAADIPLNLISESLYDGKEGIEFDNRSGFTLIDFERGKYVQFCTETPYTREFGLEKMIAELFPDLHIFFEESEPDNNIFRTNDKNEKYFIGDWFFLDDIENGSEYFDDEESLVFHFNSVHNTGCKSLKDVRRMIERINNEFGYELNVVEKKLV